MNKIKYLPDKYVDELFDIFIDNEWFSDEALGCLIFDNFCERCALLDNERERELIMELTHNYLWVKLINYEKHFINSFELLFKSDEWKQQTIKKIVICGLITEKDLEKTKSSDIMISLCKGLALSLHPELNSKNIIKYRSPKELKESKIDFDRIIFVDDYIGSGKTADDCLSYLDYPEEKYKKISIVSIVSHKKAIERLSKYGVNIFSKFVRERGISDSYPSNELANKIEIMDCIEKRLGVSRKYKRGRYKTESLVTMYRTPNNTFPFYWWKTDSYSVVPFPRFLTLDSHRRKN